MSFGEDIRAIDLFHVKEWNLISVNKSDTVEFVISKLGENKISSAPIVNEKKQPIGTVDMLDLLTFAGGKMGFKYPDSTTGFLAAKQFLQKNIYDLMNVSGRNSIYTLPSTANLQDALGLLSKPDVHRLLIVNSEGTICGVLTQSQVVHFLNSRKPQLATLMNQRVKELWKIGEKQVETIDFNKFVIDALLRLIDKNISGIAVVNDSGQIVGNISASDLKRMDVHNPYQLSYDIYESIQVFMNLSEAGHNKRLPQFEPIIVKQEDTLGSVIETIVSKGVHRVYVVDENKRPIGEISLCDIIQKFISQASE
jgi:CBS domain-containing protein